MDSTARAAAALVGLEPAALFEKFNTYPWVRDRPFMQGLAAMLGPLMPSTDMNRAVGICLQARMWWFHSKLGRKIDHLAYFAFLTANPEAMPPDEAILARMEEIQIHMGMTPSPAVPSWQAHAPRADLGVKAVDGAGRGGGKEGGQDAPYPEHFKSVIEAVTTGKPVPGVRDIPSTVVRQPGITPVGKMQAPRKPWEKLEASLRAPQPLAAEGAGESSGDEQAKGHVSSSLPQDILDQNFPPVEDDEAEVKAEAKAEEKAEEKKAEEQSDMTTVD